MSNANAWQILRERYPWPKERPDYDDKIRGWLSDGTRKMLLAHVADGSTIIELGSWLGRSARMMLGRLPRLRIVCVDHWMEDEHGSPELRGSMYAEVREQLYDRFLAACWEHRERIVPLKALTLTGLRECAEVNLRPSLVYVDASHEYEDVLADIQVASDLFPRAVLVGDDWRLKGVKRAATYAAKKYRRVLRSNDRAWMMEPKQR